MSGFDANPFGDPHENNPFADPAVTQVTNQTTRTQSGLDDYNPFAAQPQKPDNRGVVGNAPPYQKGNDKPATMQAMPEPPPAYTPVASQQTNINTAELQRRQEELERKAAELQAREEALRSAPFNARTHNWPPLPAFCCVKPCFYQDIAVDIPLEFQRVVRALYYLWMFYVCVLCLNFLGAMALMIHGSGGTTFGFSILALVLFAPLSFLCWYRPLYKAFRSDSSFNFMVFFFVFFFQMAISGIYAVGIPSVGSCGFINGINIISEQTAGGYAVGGIVLIIGFLWAMACFMSFLLLIKVHRIYRSTGASFTKAQEEFTSGILSNEHVQTAAGNAAAGAARSAMQQTMAGGGGQQGGNRF